MSTIDLIGPRLSNPKSATLDKLVARFDALMKAAENAKTPNQFRAAIAAATTLHTRIRNMRLKNPARKQKRKRIARGRSAGGLMRPSQATKRKPTKRLIKRRKITARSPKGLFANPVRHGYTVIARGAEIATFKTKAHAAQYGQAFADAYKTQVKVKR